MTEYGLSGADVVREVAAVGYSFETLAELRESRIRYREAIPVLLSAFHRTSNQNVKDEIIRALGKPWAASLVVDPLIDLFQSVDDPTGLGTRWTIGDALGSIWDDSRYDKLIALARDKSYGRAREMLVHGLGRSKRPEAVDDLIAFLDHPEVSGHAVIALRRLRATRALPHLERMLNDKRAWVRKETRKALEQLG